ncbi:MAG: hypothetical protein ACC726_03355 [Chloroflexota bacterium]
MYGGLIAEAGDDRQVSVLGEARLAPSLDGQSSDDAETPALFQTIGLHLTSRSEDRIHERLRRL